MTTTLHDQIQEAIGAHGLWKGRLLNAIQTGKFHLSASDVKRDDLCDFGHWLHKEIDETERNSTHYDKVVELHERFHDEASRIIQLVEAGKPDEATAALNGTYTVNSQALIQALKNWEGE